MRLAACILGRAQWRHGRSHDETKYTFLTVAEGAMGIVNLEEHCKISQSMCLFKLQDRFVSLGIVRFNAQTDLIVQPTMHDLYVKHDSWLPISSQMCEVHGTRGTTFLQWRNSGGRWYGVHLKNTVKYHTVCVCFCKKVWCLIGIVFFNTQIDLIVQPTMDAWFVRQTRQLTSN